MIYDADRLFNLLPAVYRARDADRGYPLRALLQVISEQVNLVDADIAQLYENWFIETCQEWVVPYIGDLIGYTPVYDTGDPSPPQGPRALVRERILIPRQEVANTVRLRRRKGTVAVLEQLASEVGGWPTRAIEFYRLLSFTQNINYLHPNRGRTVDLTDGYALQELGGPFEQSAHTIDVRSIDSKYFPELYNIPDVGVFVWRLKTYSVTEAPAYCFEEESPNFFLFSALGNDTPLYTRSVPSPAPSVGKLNLPLPITRRDLQADMTNFYGPGKRSNYYGPDKSFQILLDSKDVASDPKTVIVSADLSDWTYRPKPHYIAVDPVLGRIVFHPSQVHNKQVSVSYNYAFSTDIGGGEYDRTLSQPLSYSLYLVGIDEDHSRISDALAQWSKDAPANAVIEITDSGVYTEALNISLKGGQTLQLRAANGKRPVIWLQKTQASLPGDLSITGVASGKDEEKDCWFTLDGIVMTGRGVQVQGTLTGLTIRHSTLTPGWGLYCDCGPVSPVEASLELEEAPRCLQIEHSIIGSIQVNRDEVKEDPCLIRISDSIVDATSFERIAIGAPERLCAFAVLDIRRSTIFGKVQTHEIELGENSIFMGSILTCRRQRGCMRFCYVTPGSRTPRRYECQPDLVESAALALAGQDSLSASDTDNLLSSERLRVEPEFNSTRYGKPTYCRLADTCAIEISQGADDQSEMGVFHDLYQPQRAANLRVRLDEYTPAGMMAGIIYAS